MVRSAEKLVSKTASKPSLHAEGFAEGDADGGGDLHGGEALGVAEGGPGFAGFVLLIDGAHGAMGGALAALDAGRIVERNPGGGGDLHPFAAADEFQRPDVLHFLADDGATAALDAFVGLKDDGRRGGVALHVLHRRATEGHLADAELGRHALELAVARTGTAEAVVGVGGEDELDHRFADLDNVRIVGGDLHPFGDLGAAGPQEFGGVPVAHHADAAGSPGLHVGVVTEGGDAHGHFLRGLKEGGACRDLHGDAVDLKVNHLLGFFHGGILRQFRWRAACRCCNTGRI